MGGARKNIVVISFDDAVAPWPYRTAFGATLQMPAFDRICAASTAFHAAYCQAPVCGPSRASFMSARAPHQTGIFDNTQRVFQHVAPQDMWPYLLKEAGYYTSCGGKVHHGYKPLPRAHHAALYCDERKWFRIDRQLPPHKPKKSFGGKGGGWATTDPDDDAVFYDYQSASSFEDFITSYDGAEPFYREVGFYSPHGPQYTPARFKELYEETAFERPAAWASGYDAIPFDAFKMRETFPHAPLRRWRRSVRNYFSALSHVDHHLGRVWDALKASRFADNTVVILVSDHGLHLGDKERFSKCTLWEQVARVPLVVHDPDQSAHACDAPVALIDLGRTVLDYAGIAAPKAFMGQSLRPIVEGAAGDPDRTVPTFYFGSVGVRVGPYRLIRYENGATQFYDLAEDFWQLRDLGEDHPAFASAMSALIEASAAHGLSVLPTA